jgi:catechol 2,3-dioxygenase-like lactoylglutathione lyase family enzyme
MTIRQGGRTITDVDFSDYWCSDRHRQALLRARSRRNPQVAAGYEPPLSSTALSERDATIVGPVESLPEGRLMDVQFIASVAVITPDPSVSRRLYVDALGLPLTGSEDDDYLHSEDIDGSKHFGVWPLTQVAQACFGTPEWPADRPVPQASIEFEVADADTVQFAANELREKGFTLLHEARTEPWGQTVARLQSSEGAIIGISYAPSMHS